MLILAHHSGGGALVTVPRGTRSYVFEQIYVVFLLLGTLVGIVVIAYMLHKAYKYRASSNRGDVADRPAVGEIPSGSGGGRKLFVSFALSAIIVISLISWTYFTLLYVESPDTAADEDPLEVEVVAHQFYWEFVYPNGYSERGTLRVPEDRRVQLTVTRRTYSTTSASPNCGRKPTRYRVNGRTRGSRRRAPEPTRRTATSSVAPATRSWTPQSS